MKQKKQNCHLTSCAMCLACKSEWKPAIDTHRVTYFFEKGELLFKEGEPVKGMFFILEGMVKVHKKWDDDKELILRFAKNGAIAGHRGLGGDPFYPASATALRPTTVCYVDIDFFISTLKVNTDYLFELMLFFASELKESEKRMRNLAHMSTKGRIAYALLSLKNKFGVTETGHIDIIVSRQDLAAYTGTTYETLFKMMNEMAEEQLIETEGKKVKILNTDLLSAFCPEQ